MLGDYSYITHVRSLISVEVRQNVFAMPIDRSIDLDEDTDLSHNHGACGGRRALPDASVRYAQGC